MKNIHVLPTDKPSRLFVDIDDNKLKITQPLSGEYMMNQNIYITSDEEIKEGDCFLHPDNTVEIASRDLDGRGLKKIILTTDTDLIKDGVQAIDDKFLEWFVKNPNCEKIEIKTKYLHYYKTGEKFISFSKTPEFSSRNMQCIKIEPRYEIIIPQEEPKKMSKQTAVEWLQEKLLLSLANELKSLNGFFVIAKEMEKEQIITAYNEGSNQNGFPLKHEAEEYYNETYKNEDK